MYFYMKYGVYSYKHEEMPVGLPLAYKIKDGKVKIRVGIHDKLPMHTRVWDEMKIYGDKGGSSIRGEAENKRRSAKETSATTTSPNCLFGPCLGLATGQLTQKLLLRQ